MSDDELIDSPASHTRQRDSDLGRRAFAPLSERMKARGRVDDSSQERVKSSPRSPGRTRKNQSSSPQRSPKKQKATQREQKNQLYPDLPASDEDDTEEELSDSVEEDEQDASGINRETTDGRSPGARRRGRQESEFSDSSVPGMSPGRGLKDKNVTKLPDKSSSSQSSNCWTFVLIVAVSCIAIGLYLHQDSSDKPLIMLSSVDYYMLFKPRLENIKSQYPSQTPRFWKIINSALKRLLNEAEETYPAVLLFGIASGDSQVGTCITKSLVKALNGFYNSSEFGYISSTDLDSSDADKMKLDLDTRMIKILNSAKGVAVDHVEKLSGQTALLFHGYCDGDNAPYKNASIILALHSDKVRPNEDNVVEDILNELWEKDLGVDEMPALRSRIANNIAIVSPEVDVSC